MPQLRVRMLQLKIPHATMKLKVLQLRSSAAKYINKCFLKRNEVGQRWKRTVKDSGGVNLSQCLLNKGKKQSWPLNLSGIRTEGLSLM